MNHNPEDQPNLKEKPTSPISDKRSPEELRVSIRKKEAALLEKKSSMKEQSSEDGTQNSQDQTTPENQTKNKETLKEIPKEDKLNVTFKDGSTYEGMLKNGKPNGQGKRTLKDGGIEEGIFEDGTLINGKVTLINGTIFEGTFEAGIMGDKGITFKSGAKARRRKERNVGVMDLMVKNNKIYVTSSTNLYQISGKKISPSGHVTEYNKTFKGEVSHRATNAQENADSRAKLIQKLNTIQSKYNLSEMNYVETGRNSFIGFIDNDKETKTIKIANIYVNNLNKAISSVVEKLSPSGLKKFQELGIRLTDEDFSHTGITTKYGKKVIQINPIKSVEEIEADLTNALKEE